jgi:hypothetical protein
MSSSKTASLGSVTGRDEFIIGEALATALIALEQLPEARQPIARALSQSSTSRARLGARADEMVEELRARAETWSPNGLLTEVLISSALIARRAANH